MISLRDHLARIREVLPEEQRREKETHAGLWFDKYIVEQIRDNTDSRRDLIAEVSSLPTPVAYRAFYERWKKALDECKAKTREAEVQGRMIVGLGSESVLETSICLHRTYGVPYIPGSALKGLAASYARSKRVGIDWTKDNTAYKTVFGDTDNAGYITFFDALYTPDIEYEGQQALYPDIITVHHQKYYQDTGAAPTDSDNPIPVPFLSATGTYLIALAAPDLLQADAWIKATFDILEEALKTLGIGAKTSSGYGRMKFLQDDLQQTSQIAPVEDIYTRPPTLPTFHPGQDITGVVMKPANIEEIRQTVSIEDANAVLQFQAYPFKEVLIIIPSEYVEAATWVSGNTRISHFVREEVRGKCTVLVCKPRPPKNRDKRR